MQRFLVGLRSQNVKTSMHKVVSKLKKYIFRIGCMWPTKLKEGYLYSQRQIFFIPSPLLVATVEEYLSPKFSHLTLTLQYQHRNCVFYP